MKKHILTVLWGVAGIAFFFARPADAQTRILADQYCSYTGDKFGEDLYGFVSDEAAQRALARVMKHTGLESNFAIMAANVPNAAAVIQGQTRYILYNQGFIMKVQDLAKTDWAGLSILAHEIGHHLQGHTLLPGGSRPEIELQADKYSGFILKQMGASLEQAQAAMNALSHDVGSSTHPGKQARLAAISNGWIAARDLNAQKPDVEPANPTPAPQTPASGPQAPVPGPQNPAPSPQPPAPIPVPANSYVYRAVFPADPLQYYVTSNDDIVVLTPHGKVVPVGKRTPPTMMGFAWMYATAYITYGVDAAGKIWSRTPVGTVFQVGYVTTPNH